MAVRSAKPRLIMKALPNQPSSITLVQLLAEFNAREVICVSNLGESVTR